MTKSAHSYGPSHLYCPQHCVASVSRSKSQTLIAHYTGLSISAFWSRSTKTLATVWPTSNMMPTVTSFENSSLRAMCPSKMHTIFTPIPKGRFVFSKKYEHEGDCPQTKKLQRQANKSRRFTI